MKCGPGPRRHAVQDAMFVTITFAFFLLSIGYVHFCDRMK